MTRSFDEAVTDTEHDALDHKIAPHNLLDATAHGLLGHTTPPLSLLDAAAHDLLNHTIPPLSLLNSTTHNSDNHAGVTAIQPPSQAEAEAGVATTPRLWTSQRVGQAIDAQNKVRQVLSNRKTAVVGPLGLIAYDDTTPLISEGTQTNSQTITVLNNSKVLATFSATIGSSTSNHIIASLYRAGAIQTTTVNDVGNSNGSMISFTFLTAALSSGSHTFVVRVGRSAGNAWVNGDGGGGRRMGGASGSNLVLHEIVA